MKGTLGRLMLVGFGLAVGCAYAVIVWAAIKDSVVRSTSAILLVVAFVLLAWQLSQTTGQNMGRKLIMIALAPIALFGAMVGLGAMLLFLLPAIPVFAVQRIWRESKLKRAMSKQGRLLPLPELAPRLEAGEGTLLEETGPKGTYRIWWTSDELASLEPSIAPTERYLQLLEGIDAGEFNRLCLETYVGEADGKASLTTITPRYARSGKLARRFPNAKRVMVVRLGDV